jgi:UDP-N-acetylglucosamine--N-acetylmuramyl-(pentapeptide) pyrophosphoryl-undecaprenol N-acetylglucosamine transferase
MNNSSTLIFTGGHHTSALVVAEMLRRKGWNIIWIGHKYSMWGDTSPSAEYREVTKSGIEFIELKAGKMHNTFQPKKLFQVPLGFFRSFGILRRLKHLYGHDLRGIVTFGGYLGVPVVFCGWLLGIPTVSHEQTTVAGWANKLISVFARKIALSWPSSSKLYPRTKTELTGLPLRSEILEELRHNPVRERKVYITGGKQGSHVINQTIFHVLDELLEQYYVIHQTGSSSVHSDYDQALKIKANLTPVRRKKYEVFEYLDAKNASHQICTSSVVIGRSGAHITYELAVTKTKSVLIPIPWSSHDEQLKNAQVLSTAGLAVVLPESELGGRELLDAIDQVQSLDTKDIKLPLDAGEKMVHLIEEEFGRE